MDKAEEATCEMERLAYDGLCGKPATHRWTHGDGGETLVCDMCIMAVAVCGGELGLLAQNTNGRKIQNPKQLLQ